MTAPTNPPSRLRLRVLVLLAVTPVSMAQQPTNAAMQSDFKIFIQDFEQNYAYLDRAEKPWLTWQTRYDTAIQQAHTTKEFNTVLASALSELHDFHAEVRSPVPNRWLPAPTFADIWAEFRGADALVTAVRRGSDADRSGLHAGDLLQQINGQSIAQAVANRLGPIVISANDSSKQWALLSVLTGRADEPRSITFAGPTKTSRSISLPIERHFDRDPGELTASVLPGNIGLVRFNNSLGDQKTVAAFDRTLEQLRNTKAMILDLRDVPSGGDSSVALGIMGRFVQTMLPYQRHRIPNYGQPDIERNWMEQVAPRGPFTYTAPIFVLVDHWTGSMGEGIAIGFDAMHRAVVIGTPMAHLAGAVSDFKLPATGTDVAFATEQLLHVNGTPRQDWLPPIQAEDSARSTDLILARALAEISSNQKH